VPGAAPFGFQRVRVSLRGGWPIICAFRKAWGLSHTGAAPRPPRASLIVVPAPRTVVPAPRTVIPAPHRHPRPPRASLTVIPAPRIVVPAPHRHPEERSDEGSAFRCNPLRFQLCLACHPERSEGSLRAVSSARTRPDGPNPPRKHRESRANPAHPTAGRRRRSGTGRAGGRILLL
jgi:hypothetical protein